MPNKYIDGERRWFSHSLLLVLIVLATPCAVAAKTLVALKVTPENVGVFYQNRTQQFKAIAIFSDGSRENYTQKVGWSIRANPLSTQTLAADKVATIDENGLATVKSSWGRVNVVATYPKPEPVYVQIPGAISLLLKRECGQNYVSACTARQACEDAGGYWWSNNTCHGSKEPPPPFVFLQAIYLLLLR